jgi:hypothetical protein
MICVRTEEARNSHRSSCYSRNATIKLIKIVYKWICINIYNIYAYMKTSARKTSKSTLGQFYTTNYEYILQSFHIPNDVPIIEPFAGNGDLLKFYTTSPSATEGAYSGLHKNTEAMNSRRCSCYPRNTTIGACSGLECYDIDPKQDYIIQRDTLLNPPSFKDKFVLTNPPYLAKNKSVSKQIYDIYGCDDLYKCFIEIIIRDPCLGGIIIVPVNFISSIRANDVNLRKRFVQTYNIHKINIFEESVFNDTSYSVCSMLFMQKTSASVPDADGGLSTTTTTTPTTTTTCIVYPSQKQITFELNDVNNHTIGGEIYQLPQSAIYKIERATKNTTSRENITNICVKCIDDSIHSKIQLYIAKDGDRVIDNTPNLTERSYATLVIEPRLDTIQQQLLVEQFNVLLNEYRDKYNSLFLTNYRESNSIARKRISFGLVFQLCSYILHSAQEH